MTSVSDKSKNTRAKMKLIKLSSKSLDKAIREVERRGLNKFEKFEVKSKPSKVSKSKDKQAA
jgi:hypothetical protein